jgi:hypothetical protein
MNKTIKILSMLTGAFLLFGVQTIFAEPWYQNLKVIDGPNYRIVENSNSRVFIHETVEIIPEFGQDSITVTYAVGHWTLNIQNWYESNLISYTEYRNAINWLIVHG